MYVHHAEERNVNVRKAALPIHSVLLPHTLNALGVTVQFLFYSTSPAVGIKPLTLSASMCLSTR